MIRRDCGQTFIQSGRPSPASDLIKLLAVDQRRHRNPGTVDPLSVHPGQQQRRLEKLFEGDGLSVDPQVARFGVPGDAISASKMRARNDMDVDVQCYGCHGGTEGPPQAPQYRGLRRTSRGDTEKA